MKTVYLTVVFALTATFSLCAQFLLEETGMSTYESPAGFLYAPYSGQAYSPQESLYSPFALSLEALDLTAAYSLFSADNRLASTSFGFTPSEAWLTNAFGASYADENSSGYLETPYGTPENALKIPLGNGTYILLLIAGMYVIMKQYIRKNLRLYFLNLEKFA